MFVIGVTGGVGTGKSTVAGMLKHLGAVVLDADELAHQAMEPKRLAWRRIVKTFGQDLLNEDQTINRRQLAAVIFRDDAKRERLEAIVHPQVLRGLNAQLHRLRRIRSVRVVVLDVPLLLEVGARDLVDVLVVVTASPDVQRERLQAKYGWSEAEIQERIAAQWEVSAKVALADVVIDNSDGVEATRTQVKRLWNSVQQRNNRNSTSRRSKS